MLQKKFLRTLRRSSCDLDQEHKSCKKGSLYLFWISAQTVTKRKENKQQTQITTCMSLVDFV